MSNSSNNNNNNTNTLDWQKQLQERNKKLQKTHLHEHMDVDDDHEMSNQNNNNINNNFHDNIDNHNDNNDNKLKVSEIENKIKNIEKKKVFKSQQIDKLKNDIIQLDSQLSQLKEELKNYKDIESPNNLDEEKDQIQNKSSDVVMKNQINTDEELARQLQSQFEEELNEQDREYEEERQQHQQRQQNIQREERNNQEQSRIPPNFQNMFGFTNTNINNNDDQENPNTRSWTRVDDNGNTVYHFSHTSSNNNGNGTSYSFHSSSSSNRNNRNTSNNRQNQNPNFENFDDMFQFGINPYVMRRVSGNRTYNENMHDNRDPFNVVSPLQNLNLLLGGGFHGMSIPGRNLDDMTYEELLREFPSIPRGAHQEDIQRLPTDKYHVKKTSNNDNNNNNKDDKKQDQKDENSQCCICLENFKEGDEIRRLPCLHIFHTKEIDEWLKRNHVCPICRTAVDQDHH